MAYRGVLTDFYGTLVEEDDPVIAGVIRRIEEQHPGSDVGEAWYREFSDAVSHAHGHTFRSQHELAIDSLTTVLSGLGSSLDAEELLQDQFTYWRRPQVRPDAVEFLAACELPICVISNIDRTDLEAAIAHTGLPLPRIVASDDVRSYKPRLEIFEAGMRMLDLDPPEVLHIGDSLSADVAGANAANIDAVWLNTHHRSLPQHLMVTAQCQDLTDLLPLVSQ